MPTTKDKTITPIKTIDIHGKAYAPVAERLRVAHELEEIKGITTEFLPHATLIICKATVHTTKGTFTGTSAANPAKQIEKQSPYEVAETSAVGRALGFAGYGVVDGIATADEIVKGGYEATTESELATDKQLYLIRGLVARTKHKTLDAFEAAWGKQVGMLTVAEASALITKLQEQTETVQEPPQDEPPVDLTNTDALPF